ncbi:hypothetical protein L3X38_043207 [Prunus dulcis]|uniref:Uncharacterized protein n=1 Tax=Prunus dulcis TaxID=3755 RepID=A0AAD4YLX6_PRUDU|nr:hypothetical protein L3X38_043207 [Prunus dulcis]
MISLVSNHVDLDFFLFSKLSQWLLLLLLWIPEKLQIRSVELCLCSRKSTNQSSREASELRLKRQVVGKCDRRMLLATYCPSNRRASNGFVKTTKNLKFQLIGCWVEKSVGWKS